MRKLYLGFWDMVTKNKKPAKCTNTACTEPIEVGQQYIQVRKSWRGNGKKNSKGGEWKTKRFHIDCIQSFLVYQAKYRYNSEPGVGRPRLPIDEKLRPIRASMNRRMRYIINCMSFATELPRMEELEEKYNDLAAEIDNVTGVPWFGYTTLSRQVIISNFRNRLVALQEVNV